MSARELPMIDWKRVDALIEMAIEEDVGDGDATTLAVIPEGVRCVAELVCKEPCACAGLEVAARVFRRLDPGILWTPLADDGDFLESGSVMARLQGLARPMLTGERPALNFLQRLCGVATASRRYADAAAGGTIILDTRKTTPGWRNLEKYAVAAGGASNHRIGLFDRILVKDNHRELAGLEGPGGIGRSVQRARQAYPRLEVEVEADTLAEAVEALEAGADYILLDNMTDAQIAEAVALVAGRTRLEASGGVTLQRIPSLSATGVDFVSVGALTHSVRAVDISMDIRPAS